MDDRYEMDLQVKKIGRNIFKVLYILVIGFACIRLFFYFLDRISDHPESNWQSKYDLIKKISIEPKIDFPYFTILSEITITEPSEFKIWVNAINDSYYWDHIPSSWRGSNRNQGPKTLRLRFDYINNKFVTFEIWFCEKYSIVTCIEEYQGDHEIFLNFKTRYSDKLYRLLNTAIEKNNSTWVSSDPNKGKADAL